MLTDIEVIIDDLVVTNKGNRMLIGGEAGFTEGTNEAYFSKLWHLGTLASCLSTAATSLQIGAWVVRTPS